MTDSRDFQILIILKIVRGNKFESVNNKIYKYFIHDSE